VPTNEQNIAAVGVLAEPVRRQLYEFVCSQREPVSREMAAQAVGIAQHQAKFHLDRLEAEGLLVADYVRLTGRTGPGAGRPAKRYRPGGTQFSVSLPERRYDLAGHIMADAITTAAETGIAITDAVRQIAAAYGAGLADGVSDRPSTADEALDLAVALLSGHAYEPRRTGSTVVLVNCPFHALARRHTELVCTMNHALIAGLVEVVAPDLLNACLEPGENRCCVTLTADLAEPTL